MSHCHYYQLGPYVIVTVQQFKKSEMLTANDNDINIQLLSHPLGTGPRDKTGLWRIPIPKKE